MGRSKLGCRGHLAGHQQRQHHRTMGTKPLQHITENTLAMETVLGTSVLPEDILTHAVMQIKKNKKKKIKRQAFTLFDGIFR